MTLTTAPSTVPSVPLSTLLREGSKSEHERAEGSDFMSELLAGRISRSGYARYLAAYTHVYVALEEVAAHLAQDPVAGQIIDPALERRDAIQADLAFWSQGADVDGRTTTVDEYVHRIEATRTDPRLFVAHHYTRYLGDLSGGQAIGRILKRTYGLDDVDGIRFYEFASIPKPKPYKDAYRRQLDSLPLTETDRQAVLDEVKQAFALNSAVLAVLGATVLDSPISQTPPDRH